MISALIMIMAYTPWSSGVYDVSEAIKDRSMVRRPTIMYDGKLKLNEYGLEEPYYYSDGKKTLYSRGSSHPQFETENNVQNPSDIIVPDMFKRENMGVFDRESKEWLQAYPNETPYKGKSYGVDRGRSL